MILSIKRSALFGATLLAALTVSLGCSNQFDQRLNALLVEELRSLNDKHNQETDEFIIIRLCQSKVQVADKLIGNLSSLSKEDQAEVFETYTNALLLLNRQGDGESGEQLLKVCKDFSGNKDDHIREQCELALCSLEFQKYFKELELYDNASNIQILCSREDAGEHGKEALDLVTKFKGYFEEQVNGADRQQEMSAALESLGDLIIPVGGGGNSAPQFKLPPWLGNAQALEHSYNRLLSGFRSNQLVRSGPISDLVDLITQLGKKYPQSAAVAKAIADFADRLVTVNEFDAAGEIRKFVAENFSGSQSNSEISAVLESVGEKSTIGSLNLERLAYQWEKNPGLATAEDITHLKTQLQSAKADGKVTPAVVRRILQLANVLEHGERYDLAKDWLSFVSSELSDNAELAPLLDRYIPAATKRLGMVGQPFEFPPADLTVEPVNSEDFAGMKIYVVFWNSGERQSFEALEKVNALVKNERITDVMALNIGVDTDLDESQKTKQDMIYFTWPFAVASKLTDDGKNPFAQMYGIDYAPYCIIVNKDGVVERIGVSAAELSMRTLIEN